MYDLIVIGGGPAGLTATIYAIRKRLNVLMVTKDLGGKTNYHLELPWIEEYQVIRGLDIVRKFRNELEYLDFAHHMDSVERVEKELESFWVQTKDGSSFETRAIIVASGTRQKWLDVPGEKEYISKGLCYSALSYAPLFIEKKTVVIGNGELALRSAAELATVADSVEIVGPSGKVLETNLGKKLLSMKNVKVLEGFEVTKVMGNKFANQVEIKSPSGDKSVLDFDGAFVEKQLISNAKFLGSLVELDEFDRIVINGYNQTNIPGIFAAGDVTNTYAEQVLVAIGEGAKAALSAYDYLLPML